MHAVIDTLHKADLLSDQERALAHAAQDAGTPEHTLGYEVEVLSSAADDVPKLNLPFLEHREAETLGYGVGTDGIYELQSPPANHPIALALATYAMTRAGWLPNGTAGRITAHVSIGTPHIITDYPQESIFAPGNAGYREHLTRFVTMIRAVELLGHTTVSRLIAPIRRAKDPESDDYGHTLMAWNDKGWGGVKIYWNAELGQEWGNSNRVELRTFGFYSPEQFSKLLTTIYFLSRGLTSGPNSEARVIYGDYEQWLRDYLEDHRLPAFTVNNINTRREFASYIEPYVEHLASSDRSVLIAQTNATVDALTETFGLQHLRLPKFNS